VTVVDEVRISDTPHKHRHLVSGSVCQLAALLIDWFLSWIWCWRRSSQRVGFDQWS